MKYLMRENIKAVAFALIVAAFIWPTTQLGALVAFGLAWAGLERRGRATD